jgi:hypothetical protein
MFSLKSNNDSLGELLENAQKLVAKRNNVIESIQAAESILAEANEQIGATKERVAAEEFEAAQKEGGLAIASKAAQAGVAEAELKAKSCRLRLQGLQAQREKIEADLVPAWEKLKVFRDDFFLQSASELSEQFQAAVDSFRGLICKALALRHHAGAHSREKYGFHLGWITQMLLFNPIAGSGERSSIRIGIFSDGRGKTWDLGQDWGKDPEAGGLDLAIQSIDDRIAPIGAVMAEVRPKQLS